MRAARFDEYGDVEVLEVVDVPRPSPGPNQVLVRVKATGINPGEGKIRQGMLHARWPTTFASGEGSDLAGVIEEVGSAVHDWSTGDEVIGKLEIPLAATYPLSEVQAAFHQLEAGHVRGKMVLVP